MKINKRFAIVLSAAIMISFAVGAAAFPVFVRRISPISSSENFVSRARLSVFDVQWVIDPRTSTVEGIILDVNNTDTLSAHIFKIVVQVSCLSSGAVLRDATGIIHVFPSSPFICTGGSVASLQIKADGDARLFVDFVTAIDPEVTQIENLSFIVTEVS